MKPDVRAELAAFGELVQAQRITLGMSLREVAEKAMISLATISRIESGKHEAGLFVAYRLCIVLGVSVDVLMSYAIERAEKERDSHN